MFGIQRNKIKAFDALDGKPLSEKRWCGAIKKLLKYTTDLETHLIFFKDVVTKLQKLSRVLIRLLTLHYLK